MRTETPKDRADGRQPSRTRKPLKSKCRAKARHSGERSRWTKKEALAKRKSEVVRMGLNGTRRAFKLAEAMFKKYPELKNA